MNRLELIWCPQLYRSHGEYFCCKLTHHHEAGRKRKLGQDVWPQRVGRYHCLKIHSCSGQVSKCFPKVEKSNPEEQTSKLLVLSFHYFWIFLHIFLAGPKTQSMRGCSSSGAQYEAVLPDSTCIYCQIMWEWWPSKEKEVAPHLHSSLVELANVQKAVSSQFHRP